MAIRKQEFYEGAALHLLVRSGKIASIRYVAPLFLVNGRLSLLLKYSTKGRSPWGFTFTPEEQVLLQDTASKTKTVIGLICGADGIAAFSYDEFRTIAALKESSIHIACYRDYGEHYEVNGPDGRLGGKVAPSDWRRILSDEVTE